MAAGFRGDERAAVERSRIDVAPRLPTPRPRSLAAGAVPRIGMAPGLPPPPARMRSAVARPHTGSVCRRSIVAGVTEGGGTVTQRPRPGGELS